MHSWSRMVPITRVALRSHIDGDQVCLTPRPLYRHSDIQWSVLCRGGQDTHHVLCCTSALSNQHAILIKTKIKRSSKVVDTCQVEGGGVGWHVGVKLKFVLEYSKPTIAVYDRLKVPTNTS